MGAFIKEEPAIQEDERGFEEFNELQRQFTLRIFTPDTNRIRNWLKRNTLTVEWLPKALRAPQYGYVIAVLLSLIAVAISYGLDELDSQFTFSGLFPLLVITIVALNWGCAPSIFTTILTTFLAYVALIPPPLTWKVTRWQDAFDILFLLVTGFIISNLAGKLQFERSIARTLSSRLTAVLSAMPGAVSWYDKNGTIMYQNSQGKHLPVDSESSSWDEMIERYNIRYPGQARLGSQDLPFARALHGETVINRKLLYEDSYGNTLCSLMNAAPLLNEGGLVDGAVAITNDITQLYLAEQIVTDKVQELEGILESISDGVCVFDVQGNISKMNSTARTMFEHLKRKDSSLDAASSVEDMKSEQTLSKEMLGIPELLRGEVQGSAPPLDLSMIDQNGNSVFLNISNSQIIGETGNTLGVVSILRDITERLHLYRRVSEAFYTLLEMAHTLVKLPNELQSGESENHAVFEKLAQLTLKVLDCRIVSIFGIDRESGSLIPYVLAGVPAEYVQTWRDYMSGMKFNDPPVNEQLYTKLKAGEIIHLDVSTSPYAALPNPYNVRQVLLAPIRLAQGTINVLTIALDESKGFTYSEESLALIRAVADLIGIVVDRDRILMEREEARGEALVLERLNQQTDGFLNITSHELRTPITSAKTFVQLARRRLMAGEDGADHAVKVLTYETLQNIAHLLDRADTQINSENRLIDNLLDLTAIQSAQLHLKLEQHNLGNLVREVIRTFGESKPQRIIKVDIIPNIEVMVDKQRIMQVLNNYLSNAAKYSTENSPIEVAVMNRNGTVRVSVKDYGVGVTEQEPGHIWERFYRFKEKRDEQEMLTRSEGMGMSLYICKMIIEGHHGQVGVDSVKNEGATFWFDLPVGPAQPPDPGV